MTSTWSSWDLNHLLGLVALVSFWLAFDRTMAKKPTSWRLSSSLWTRRKGQQ